MVTQFLTYDLKVAVLLAVFYFCYRLLMERETLHHLNRMVLLSTLALSMVLPLCVITLHETVWVEPQPAAVVAPGTTPAYEALGDRLAETASAAWWQWLLAGVIVAGMAARLLFLLQSYLKLYRLMASGEYYPMADGIRLCVVEAPVAPFSWMQTIVVRRHDYMEHNPLLLQHERGHIRLHHSWDIVFVEMLTVLQWFNPVVWLLSRDLRTVHEFEVDASVLSQGADMAQYISLLTAKATGIQACALANGINTSNLKKRIDMIIKRKSPRLAWLRALYVAPVVALSLAATAETVTEYKTKEPQKKVVVKKGRKNSQVKMNSKAIEVKEAEAGKTAEKPFVLHVIRDEYNRVIGMTTADKPEAPYHFDPIAYPLGYIFVNGHEATLEEALNYSKFDKYSLLRNPYGSKDSKWNGKEKHGIVNFYNDDDLTSKQNDAPADDDTPLVFDICEQMPRFPGGDVELMKFIAKNIKYPVAATKWGVQGRVFVRFIVEKDGSVTSPEVVKTTGFEGNQDIAVVSIANEDMTADERKEAEAQDAGLKAGKEALEQEAIRVIKLMPKWEPGRQNGKVVRCHFSIPVSYRLS